MKRIIIISSITLGVLVLTGAILFFVGVFTNGDFMPLRSVIRFPISLSVEAKCALTPNAKIQHLGFSGFPQCVRSYDDAGKSCESGSTCKSKNCIADWKKLNPKTAKPGDKVTGVCAQTDLSSCWDMSTTVENGKLGYTSICD